MLKVATECSEHGVEMIESEAVALITDSGRVYTFSEDPETGGLLVGCAGQTISVGLLKEGDSIRPDACVLLVKPTLAVEPEIPKRRLN